MNWQSFISLIQFPQESTFFISSARQEDQIGKTLSALLNTHGGILIVGYDKINVHLTGYNQSDEWINHFIETHFNGTLSITSAFLFRSNKKVLILEVIKAESPQSYKNIFYMLNNKTIEEFQPQTTPTFNYQISEPLEANQFNPDNEKMINFDTNPIPKNKPPLYASPIKILPELNSSTENSNETIKNNNFNHRQMDALNYVNEHGAIKNKLYRKLFEVSHKTAHIELAELVSKKKLSISGSGRSTCYVQFQSKEESISNHQENNTKEQLLSSFIARKNKITETIYADEFNIDLAQAINELKQFCDQGILEKTIIENEVFYIKANQLSFI
ncbi:MAG: RNA-binding domain-containing protein [Candidatus Margulisiibacteriota bacterium]